ncbi:MAG TPA: hypothetical protein VHP83_19815 [Aggregatilineaceae bacterium]|nr:hypothetical protein [Aggregatilineaceae bacterium]
MLGQYNAVANDVKETLLTIQKQPDDMPDLHGGSSHQVTDVILFQGLSQCNLGDLGAAELAFSWAIQREPDYALLFVLRGQIHQLKGETAAADKDFEQARQLSPSPDFLPWIEAAVRGDWTCQNLLDYTLPE